MSGVYQLKRAEISEEEATQVEACVFQIRTLQAILKLIEDRNLPNREYYQQSHMEKQMDLRLLHGRLAERYFPRTQARNIRVNYKDHFLFCEIEDTEEQA